MCQTTYMQLKILLAIQNMRHPILDAFFVGLSAVNKNFMIIIIGLILYLLIKRNVKVTVYLFATLLLNVVLTQYLIKPLMAVARPFTYIDTVELLIKAPTSYSFPSTHTATMVCLAVSVYYLNKKWGIGLIIAALIVGFSRMYLFVHFPLDVIAGALIGWIVADSVAMLNKRFHWITA